MPTNEPFACSCGGVGFPLPLLVSLHLPATETFRPLLVRPGFCTLVSERPTQLFMVAILLEAVRVCGQSFALLCHMDCPTHD